MRSGQSLSGLIDEVVRCWAPHTPTEELREAITALCEFTGHPRDEFLRRLNDHLRSSVAAVAVDGPRTGPKT